jgi:hypothetical protein
MSEENVSPQEMARHFVNYEVIRRSNPALAARYRATHNEEITAARRLLGLTPTVVVRVSSERAAQDTGPQHMLVPSTTIQMPDWLLECAKETDRAVERGAFVYMDDAA